MHPNRLGYHDFGDLLAGGALAVADRPLDVLQSAGKVGARIDG